MGMAKKDLNATPSFAPKEMNQRKGKLTGRANWVSLRHKTAESSVGDVPRIDNTVRIHSCRIRLHKFVCSIL